MTCLGPRINFIVGRNGSGKSAILTAIVLGFGGRAATTSRGKGIASFIKSGETQAKVIIRICNHNERGNGKNGFRVDEFGKSIIIERTLNSSGASTYKIKNAAGKVVADRKDVLEDIIRYFNIQVDNPVCVLNQEVSRNFLNTKNAKDKYTFFMKATLLEDMKNEYTNSEVYRSNAIELLATKEKVLPQTAKDIKQLEQKVKMFNALEDHKEKFIKLNNEALWSLVYEQRKKLEVVTAQCEKLTKKCDEELEKVNKEKETIQNLKADKQKAIERLNGFVQEVQALNDIVNEMKTKWDEMRDKVRAKDKEERTVQTEHKINENDIKNLEEKIKKYNVEFSDEITNKRRGDIAKLREEIQELRNQENDVNSGYQEIREAVERMSDEKVKLRQQFNKLDGDIKDKKQTIDRIEHSRKERLHRFGPKFPELVKQIEIAHKRGDFRHKPVGPIGNHIQLKNNACALAVELCLQRSIFAFCCDNNEDANKLRDIMRRVFGSDRLPQIITRPFGPLHDVSQYRVRSDQYKSLLELMTIKEAPIANALIDQFRIESILFIPDYREAQDLLMDRQSVPANCIHAYTAMGDMMFPNTAHSEYKSYANNSKKSAQYLMKNVDQMLGQLREEVQALSQEHRRLELELKQKSTALEAKQKETSGLDARKKQIRHNMFNKDTKLKQLEAIGDSPPIEVATLEEERQNNVDKRKEFEERLEKLRTEKEELNRLYDEAEEQWRAKKTEYELLMNERMPMRLKLDEIKTDLEKHQLILQKYEQKLNETTAAKDEEERKVAANEEEVKRDEEVALQQTGEQIETNRSSKSVYNEIKQLEKFLDEQENTIGDKEEIYKRYQTSLAHYKKVKEEVAALQKQLKRLKVALELRKRGYAELRNFYTMMTKINFSSILSNKNFSGSLEVYHKNKEVNGELKKAKTLEIRVNPKSDEQENSQESVILSYSDTRSLSGGERSFSTVAFILALWESAQSPFKILDEVDVFMDLVTRQISLDAMIEFAATKSGKQYIFLSPLKIQKLINPELIQIFQMPEPQRTE